ncbi:MAG: hypothetical protein AAGH89_11690 [Verrucomicrobiota bacterium]
MFWRIGRKHMATGGEEALSGDSRPPILYLRSFADDKTVYLEEEQLAGVFGPAGPFVAIGRPGERLPQLGAARLYVADEDWQDRVLELMQRAQLVVLFGGETPGLGWELRQLRLHVDPHRVVFLVPHSEASYEKFRSLMLQAGFGAPAWPSEKERKHATFVAGLIRFGSDWTPRFVPLPKAVGKGIAYEADPRFGGTGRVWAAMRMVGKDIGIRTASVPISVVRPIYLLFRGAMVLMGWLTVLAIALLVIAYFLGFIPL